MNNAKERPIALTAQEVNAVLAGDKTQHRVPVDIEHSVALTYHSLEAGGASPERIDALPFECPFGAIGDRLWVQEDHARQSRWEQKFSLTGAHYFADGPLTLDVRHDAGLLERHSATDMPRWASRLLLEITDIRIERLKDVSEDDAIAQGVKRQGKSWVNYKFLTDSHCAIDARTSFATFWQSNNGDNSWDLNPWVWVIEFKVIKPSEVQGG